MLKVLFFFFILLPTAAAGAQGIVDEQKGMTYSLQEIIAIALERKSHSLLKGKGSSSKRRGSARSASAYPNPTVSVQSGRGSIRDPSANTSITERYVTLSQPLEWPGTRHAQQQATRAGVEGARAGLDEVRLNVIAQIKKGFFRVTPCGARSQTLARESSNRESTQQGRPSPCEGRRSPSL